MICHYWAQNIVASARFRSAYSHSFIFFISLDGNSFSLIDIFLEKKRLIFYGNLFEMIFFFLCFGEIAVDNHFIVERGIILLYIEMGTNLSRGKILCESLCTIQHSELSRTTKFFSYQEYIFFALCQQKIWKKTESD